jgi:type III pantothenate kinase
MSVSDGNRQMTQSTFLLVDAGNTRIKFALLRGGRLSRQRAIAHGGRVDAAMLRLLATATRGVTAVHLVSVAGARFDRRLVAALKRHGAVTVVQFRSTARYGALRNGYRDHWRFGADRWAGLLGAWSLRRGKRPLLVASVGTALTVDLIDATGRHRGGVIAPGVSLMVRSLLGRTAGIAVRARGLSAGSGRLFAADTAQALASGSLMAGVGLIERLHREASALLGQKPQLLLTGGGAPALAPRLKLPFELVTDLNLRGLAFALQTPATVGAPRRRRA